MDIIRNQDRNMSDNETNLNLQRMGEVSVVAYGGEGEGEELRGQ